MEAATAACPWWCVVNHGDAGQAVRSDLLHAGKPVLVQSQHDGWPPITVRPFESHTHDNVVTRKIIVDGAVDHPLSDGTARRLAVVLLQLAAMLDAGSQS